MLMHITDSTEEGTVSIGAKLSKSNTAVPNFLSELSLLEKIQLTETLSSTILPPVEVGCFCTAQVLHSSMNRRFRMTAMISSLLRRVR